MSNKKTPKGQYGIKPNSIGKIPWPILTAGEPPILNLDTWKLKVYGEVNSPIELNWSEFNKIPSIETKADMHCVTKWTIYDMNWEGVNFYDLVKLVNPKDSAISVKFKAKDDVNYETSIKYDNSKKLLYFEYDLDERKDFKDSPHSFIQDDRIYFNTVILATKANNETLSADHGGPMRVIIPDLYAWKGTKFCTEIEFCKTHELGFWEIRGYSDSADPFTEDRYTDDIARKIKAEVYKSFKKPRES
ncbi:MAG: molybdopterin-dependent oxidoreductase [bacterium]